MNKTKIEWCDFTINPIKGLCRNVCSYCYARRMYKRFKWDEYIRQDMNCFYNISGLKKPSKIFVGSTHDIFGKWIPHHWIDEILSVIKTYYSKHIFIFLTKNPDRYEEFIFPNNCWLGTSIESNDNLNRLFELVLAVEGRNKMFVSFEPLLTEMKDLNIAEFWDFISDLDWIIIGGLTPKPVHKKEWVKRIMDAKKDFNIPIFLKDNLKYPEVIREYPR